MKKQLISMVLMAAMTVSMLTGCKTAGGKRQRHRPLGIRQRLRQRQKMRKKHLKAERTILTTGNWQPQRAVITI